jgi:hypothetical protein
LAKDTTAALAKDTTAALAKDTAAALAKDAAPALAADSAGAAAPAKNPAAALAENCSIREALQLIVNDLADSYEGSDEEPRSKRNPRCRARLSAKAGRLIQRFKLQP